MKLGLLCTERYNDIRAHVYPYRGAMLEWLFLAVPAWFILKTAEHESLIFFSGFMSGIATALEEQRVMDGKETRFGSSA